MLLYQSLVRKNKKVSSNKKNKKQNNNKKMTNLALHMGLPFFILFSAV